VWLRQHNLIRWAFVVEVRRALQSYTT
jgi:hypothetical protein